MPQETKWYIQSKVLYIRIWDTISADVIAAMVESINNHSAECDNGLLHVITDVSHAVQLPTVIDLGRVAHTHCPPDNMGWSVTLGTQNRMVQFLTTVGHQMLNIRQRPVASLKDAVEFLSDLDPDIDWSKADNSILPGYLTTSRRPNITTV